MRTFWPIIGVVLTSALWRISGQWEWIIPGNFKQKILEWERKWYGSQIIIRVMSDGPIEDLEQFAWSLKSSLPKLQRELGVPVRLEIEWKEPEWAAVLAKCSRPDSSNHVVEIQNGSDEVQEISQQWGENNVYFSCLSRRFPELFWVGQAELE